MELYDLKNLIKENTCFKSLKNPLCIDLSFTNCSRSFQNNVVVPTDVSDCHKMIITCRSYKKMIILKRGMLKRL